MRFEPIKVFDDDAQRVDVHDDPPGLWQRVVVVCGWQSAKIARRRWPDAAAVGPLRTVEGVDLLVRSLLQNPQVRVVVIDGPTAERAFAALLDLWAEYTSTTPVLDAGLAQHCEMLRTGVGLLCVRYRPFQPDDLNAIEDADRPGGRIVLPPPPPTASASAPHGDPGQRVAGRTLADVWPRALGAGSTSNLDPGVRSDTRGDSELRHGSDPDHAVEARSSFELKPPSPVIQYAEVLETLIGHRKAGTLTAEIEEELLSLGEQLWDQISDDDRDILNEELFASKRSLAEILDDIAASLPAAGSPGMAVDADWLASAVSSTCSRCGAPVGMACAPPHGIHPERVAASVR